MKSSDRTILLVLPVVVLVAGFYLLVISPKRSEISDLNDEVAAVQSDLDAAEAQIAAGEAARANFSENYTQIVKLGKAAPADGGQANLIYEFAELGKENKVEFRSFAVSGEGGQATPADAVAPAAPGPAPPGTPEGGGVPDPATPAPEGGSPAPAPEGGSPAPAPEGGAPGAPAPPIAQAVEVSTANADATEAVAASLPLGATVGPAGLPLMPYQFSFQGDFFKIADFFADIDGLVTTKKDGMPVVDGRLVTIDSFVLTADPDTGFPDLQADFDVTTYIVPPEQGLSAGVTPAGPTPGGLVSTPNATGGG